MDFVSWDKMTFPIWWESHKKIHGSSHHQPEKLIWSAQNGTSPGDWFNQNDDLIPRDELGLIAKITWPKTCYWYINNSNKLEMGFVN